MYIEPSTNIRILKGVPLDNSYTNSLYFSSQPAQTNYFMGRTKYNLNGQTFQRRAQGSARVQIPIGNLYDCNYIMYQNSGFSNKWFYGFITSVEYLNNNNSVINFEIDVIQTWYFNWSFGECFIERQHTETDHIGGNLVPENLELGEYVMRSPVSTNFTDSYKICVAATFKVIWDSADTAILKLEDSPGGTYNGVYSGLYLNYVNSGEKVNTILNFASAPTVNKLSGIVSIFLIPTEFAIEPGQTAKTITLSINKNRETVDGYPPKNNKLFTYPYCYIYATDLAGNYAEYRYEDFSTSPCQFAVRGETGCTTSAIMWPINYKGVVNNYVEQLTLGNFPICSYNTDFFKAWLAQNMTSVGAGLLGGTVSTLAGITSANPAMVAGGIAAIGGTVQKITQSSVKPPEFRGDTSSNLLWANGLKNYYLYPVSIKQEFAKIIDEFFTCYGYAIHRVQKPVLRARKRWTYLKTIDCQLKNTNLPADDCKKVKDIFNKGITFWVNASDVGDYSQDNEVL